MLEEVLGDAVGTQPGAAQVVEEDEGEACWAYERGGGHLSQVPSDALLNLCRVGDMRGAVVDTGWLIQRDSGYAEMMCITLPSTHRRCTNGRQHCQVHNTTRNTDNTGETKPHAPTVLQPIHAVQTHAPTVLQPIHPVQTHHAQQQPSVVCKFRCSSSHYLLHKGVCIPRELLQ